MLEVTSRFENKQSEQWEFSFDFESLSGHLSGEAIDWALYEVFEGTVEELPLFPDEKRWLKSEWSQVLKRIPRRKRKNLQIARKEWSPNDIRDIIANPMYAGIGPLEVHTNGEKRYFTVEPIISDDQFIEVQIRRIQELGARRAIQQMRGTLHKYLGAHVESISYEGWLDFAVENVTHNGPKPFLKEFLSKLRSEQVEAVPTALSQVSVQDVTGALLNNLITDPNEIYKISPEVFEQLICDRLDKMGLDVRRVGRNAYQKDGGIDAIAWPKASPFPFLMAVQMKHRRSAETLNGPEVIRDLFGVVNSNSLPFSAGVLVTNTTFTPDAKWFARQQARILRLRDIDHLRHWLNDEYLDYKELRTLPQRIEVCPGVFLEIPEFK